MLRGVFGSGGGAAIGGGGTSSPSTIPRWTGPSTLGDSGLIDDGTQVYTTARSRFGIGIATPDQGLHVLSPNNATTSGGQVTQQNFNGVSNQKWMIAVGGGDNAWVSGRGWFLRDMTAGATRLVCDTSGNVGIKQSSPSSWEPGMRDIVVGALDGSSYGITLASTTQTTLAFSNGTTGTQKYAGFVQYSPGTSRLDFGTGGAARVGVITTGLDVSTSGYGIKLQGTAGTNNTDPNVLDFYADGGTANSGGVAWTPTLKFGGNTTGITYNTQMGRYTRIGNMVFASCYIRLTSKGTATGAATIDGLPTCVNLAGFYAAGAIGYTAAITSTGTMQINMLANQTQLTIRQVTAVGVNTAVTDTDFANGSEIIVSISYPVN